MPDSPEVKRARAKAYYEENAAASRLIYAVRSLITGRKPATKTLQEYNCGERKSPVSVRSIRDSEPCSRKLTGSSWRGCTRIRVRSRPSTSPGFSTMRPRRSPHAMTTRSASRTPRGSAPRHPSHESTPFGAVTWRNTIWAARVRAKSCRTVG
jgi:hypothetical protein